MTELSEKQVEELMERVVERAFHKLGIDPKDAREAQRDFAFLRDMRTGTQSIKSKTLWVVLAAMATAICGFVWAGFKAALGSS